MDLVQEWDQGQGVACRRAKRGGGTYRRRRRCCFSRPRPHSARRRSRLPLVGTSGAETSQKQRQRPDKIDLSGVQSTSGLLTSGLVDEPYHVLEVDGEVCLRHVRLVDVLRYQLHLRWRVEGQRSAFLFLIQWCGRRSGGVSPLGQAWQTERVWVMPFSLKKAGR